MVGFVVLKLCFRSDAVFSRCSDLHAAFSSRSQAAAFGSLEMRHDHGQFGFSSPEEDEAFRNMIPWHTTHPEQRKLMSTSRRRVEALVRLFSINCREQGPQCCSPLAKQVLLAASFSHLLAQEGLGKETPFEEACHDVLCGSFFSSLEPGDSHLRW